MTPLTTPSPASSSSARHATAKEGPRFFSATRSTRLPHPMIFFVADESSCDLSSRIAAVGAADDVVECGTVEVACVDCRVARADDCLDVLSEDVCCSLCVACSSIGPIDLAAMIRPGHARDDDDDRDGEQDGEDDQHAAPSTQTTSSQPSRSMSGIECSSINACFRMLSVGTPFAPRDA